MKIKAKAPKLVYVCQNCGQSCARWLGRCPGCEEWNTLVEEREPSAPIGAPTIARRREPGGPRAVPLTDASADEEGASGNAHARMTTGSRELDRVLGGGMVPDSFILLGGDPGVGKSTLLLQLARGAIAGPDGPKLLYCSGEESVEQIRGRARRLGVGASDRILLASETWLEGVFALVEEHQPQILVLDSLQTFASQALESSPGSVSQLREVAARLMTLAKGTGICVWIVGHVTKDGAIAGPKVVEHMVDTVLYFETEPGQSFRLLRAVKNRFGSTRELGVFQMEGEGLREVENPSSLFLTERAHAVPGTAITCSLEGSRPLLVELQALVAGSNLASPRRTSVGFEPARLSLLAAILERHLKLPLAKEDLFFNVAGGLRLADPACDLAAAVAIWSSAEDFAVPGDMVFLGELGLTGEVRRVSQPSVRAEEAKKLGFRTIVGPKGLEPPAGVRHLVINRIEELGALFRDPPPRRQAAAAPAN